MSQPRANYNSTVQALLREERLAPLGPGKPNEAVRPLLAALTNESLLAPHPVRDPDMAAVCIAGLWLYHDFLDEAHKISQDIETPTGRYWHGVMHRREPDALNAAHWFRRVGRHPIFGPLHVEARRLAAEESGFSASFGQSTWDPFAFIDLCESAREGHSPCELLCRRIQQREWALLFEYCWRTAGGEGH